MQIINFKSTQTFIIKINLNNALKFNPFVQQLLNTPISHIRLTRSTHPHNYCCSTLLLDEIQMANLDVRRNAIFIEFAQYFTYYLFHGEYCTKLLPKYQQYWQSFYANISIIHFQEIVLYCYVITIDNPYHNPIHKAVHNPNSVSAKDLLRRLWALRRPFNPSSAS